MPQYFLPKKGQKTTTSKYDIAVIPALGLALALAALFHGCSEGAQKIPDKGTEKKKDFLARQLKTSDFESYTARTDLISPSVMPKQFIN